MRYPVPRLETSRNVLRLAPGSRRSRCTLVTWRADEQVNNNTDTWGLPKQSDVQLCIHKEVTMAGLFQSYSRIATRRREFSEFNATVTVPTTLCNVYYGEFGNIGF